jgi:hypothetical protein
VTGWIPNLEFANDSSTANADRGLLLVQAVFISENRTDTVCLVFGGGFMVIWNERTTVDLTLGGYETTSCCVPLLNLDIVVNERDAHHGKVRDRLLCFLDNEVCVWARLVTEAAEPRAAIHHG